MANVERRKHAVCVTRAAEYHLRDGICVGVRRRGEWVQNHVAEGVRLASTGAFPPLGASLRFASSGVAMATGIVVAIARPTRDTAARYR